MSDKCTECRLPFEEADLVKMRADIASYHELKKIVDSRDYIIADAEERLRVALVGKEMLETKSRNHLKGLRKVTLTLLEAETELEAARTALLEVLS